MRSNYLLLLIASSIFFSCKKEADAPQPTVPPINPAAAGLLKDIVIPHLPSPYYHFEYDTAGKPNLASFASGLYMYDIVYSGNRISEMKNSWGLNSYRLQYEYDSTGKVSMIGYINASGITYRRVFFTYNGQKLFRAKREVNPGTGFIVEKTVLFQYGADDNLLEMITHWSAIPAAGQTETIYSDWFQQYDDKINTDGFSLMHEEFFDHLILLPGITLQKNNPGKIIHTGDGVNYKIDYTYTYNDLNVPLSKMGAGIWLNGVDSGKGFESSSVFSYY
jgi:hypothetical protein